MTRESQLRRIRCAGRELLARAREPANVSADNDGSRMHIFYMTEAGPRSTARCAARLREFLVQLGIYLDRVEWKPEGRLHFCGEGDFDAIKFEGSVLPIKGAA